MALDRAGSSASRRALLRSRAMSATASGFPACPICTATLSSAAWPGLTEIRGTTADSFWTWRDLMYRFVGRMTADDIEAVAAQAYVEMLEAGFTRVGEFHYIHHDVSGAPYAQYRRTGRAHRGCGAGQRHRPDAAAGILRPCRLRRHALPSAASSASSTASTASRGCWRRAAAPWQGSRARWSALAPHSLRAVTPEELAAMLQLDRDGPVHIHIAEQIREVDECLAWSGQRPLQWLLDHVAGRSPMVSDPCYPRDRRRNSAQLAESGAVAGSVPGHRGQSRRRHLQCRRNSSVAAACSASARIPTS